MNASEITFGIEIETTIPLNLLVVGPHGGGLPIPQLPGWKADRDPSIVAHGRDACEFVSPVYRGSDGLKQLIADVRKIKLLGAKINPSCGLHIHVGFPRGDAAAMKRLTTLASNFEIALYAVTGTKTRQRGRWCGSIRRWQTADTAMQNATYNRYHVVNLGSEHPTVEFRAFAGSMNLIKLAGYVAMCVALVERAINGKRISKWAPKPTVESSPLHRNGDGQTQLCRFFYCMGWIKGQQPFTFGNLFGPELPSLKIVKRMLMGMAREYDAMT